MKTNPLILIEWFWFNSTFYGKDLKCKINLGLLSNPIFGIQSNVGVIHVGITSDITEKKLQKENLILKRFL